MRMRTVAVKLLKALRMRSAVLHPFYWVTKPSCLNDFYDLLFTGFFYNRSEKKITRSLRVNVNVNVKCVRKFTNLNPLYI